MLEKAFRAKRFDDAIAKVKSELGPDAVIVSTRELIEGRTDGARVEVRAIRLEEARRAGYGLGGESGTLSSFERRLVRMGVPAVVAHALARHVVDELGGEPPNLMAAKPALATALDKELVYGGPLGAEARVVALVGPTGVGKTTTIAKLAAVAALLQRRNVGLVSLDQYRIGATEQLEYYSELIGIPMEVAHDARSLEIALRRLGQQDLVFVDTAGRTPKDIAAVGELADCLHGVHEEVEIALCLPAAIRDAELTATIEVLAPIGPSRLVSTKLDEAIHLGAVVAAQRLSGLPFSYFTTGQRVPEDIELATPGRLSSLMCGEEVEGQ
jgi:flagellar biosynthesis protein FlhF